MISLPIVLHGRVINGNHIGRKISMPTANIIPKEDISGIEFGVYYSRVLAGEKNYKGITNVGKKPTVNDGDTVNVETYIFDFDGDLYDQDISVELLEFRRPERKFNSIEELSEQMRKDLEAGREY